MTLGYCCRACDFGRPCIHTKRVQDNVYARTFEPQRKQTDMTIKTETTFADLHLEASKRGVEMITTKLTAGKVLAGLWVQDDLIMGEGPTIDAALDMAFERLDKKRALAFAATMGAGR